MIGLDGVIAQQANYARSGFKLAYANIRYGGSAIGRCPRQADVVPLGEVPIAAVEASDAAVFPAGAPHLYRLGSTRQDMSVVLSCAMAGLRPGA